MLLILWTVYSDVSCSVSLMESVGVFFMKFVKTFKTIIFFPLCVGLPDLWVETFDGIFHFNELYSIQ